jgi:hypothetical protein
VLVGLSFVWGDLRKLLIQAWCPSGEPRSSPREQQARLEGVKWPKMEGTPSASRRGGGLEEWHLRQRDCVATWATGRHAGRSQENPPWQRCAQQADVPRGGLAVRSDAASGTDADTLAA